MSDPTTPNADRQHRLEEAMAEYLLAADAGRAPQAEDFLARYPDLRAELAAFIADQAGLAKVIEPLAGRTGPAGCPRQLASHPVERPLLAMPRPSHRRPRRGCRAAIRCRRAGSTVGDGAEAPAKIRPSRPASATSATTRSRPSSAAAAWASSTGPARSASTGPSPSR